MKGTVEFQLAIFGYGGLYNAYGCIRAMFAVTDELGLISVTLAVILNLQLYLSLFDNLIHRKSTTDLQIFNVIFCFLEIRN